MTPLTNDEKRDIWEECYTWVQSQKVIRPNDPHQEALRRYPDPVNSIPVNDLIKIGKRDRELLQAGFVKGAEWHHRNRHDPICMADALAAAKLAYPDTYEPTIVTLENGEFAQFHCGKLRRRSKPDIPWQLTRMTPHDCLALAEAAKEAVAHEYSERTKE